MASDFFELVSFSAFCIPSVRSVISSSYRTRRLALDPGTYPSITILRVCQCLEFQTEDAIQLGLVFMASRYAPVGISCLHSFVMMRYPSHFIDFTFSTKSRK